LPGSWWFICKLVINYVWIKENWWSITYMLNTNKKIRNCGIKLNYLFDFLEPSLIYLVNFVRSSNPWMYYLIYNDDDSFSLINYRFLFFFFWWIYSVFAWDCLYCEFVHAFYGFNLRIQCRFLHLNYCFILFYFRWFW